MIIGIILIITIFVYFLFFRNIFKKQKKYKPVDLKFLNKEQENCRSENKVEKEPELHSDGIRNDAKKNIPNYNKPLIKMQKIDHPLSLETTNRIVYQFKLKENSKDIYEFVNYYLENFKSNNLHLDCIYFLFKNFKFKNILKKLEISEYIIWNCSNQFQINDVYNDIIYISSNKKVYNTNTRINAIDILKRSNNKYYIDISNKLLNEIRQNERTNTTYRNINQVRNILTEIREKVIPLNQIRDEDEYEFQLALLNDIHRLQGIENNLFRNQDKKLNIYDDSQNVHNSNVNQSVISVATNLTTNSITGIKGDIQAELEKYYPRYKQNEKKIKKSLERIETDTSKFNNLTLKDVLNNIYNYISCSIYKNEMLITLGDELTAMSELCSTGHISRLINSIQGFPDIPDNLKIKINPKDEIYATIQTYLNNEIQNDVNSEEHLDNMVSENSREKQKYYDFICEKMRFKWKILEKEYNGIIDKTLLELNIEDSLRNYMKDENGVVYVMKKIKNDF